MERLLKVMDKENSSLGRTRNSLAWCLISEYGNLEFKTEKQILWKQLKKKKKVKNTVQEKPWKALRILSSGGIEMCVNADWGKF